MRMPFSSSPASDNRNPSPPRRLPPEVPSAPNDNDDADDHDEYQPPKVPETLQFDLPNPPDRKISLKRKRRSTENKPNENMTDEEVEQWRLQNRHKSTKAYNFHESLYLEYAPKEIAFKQQILDRLNTLLSELNEMTKNRSERSQCTVNRVSEKPGPSHAVLKPTSGTKSKYLRAISANMSAHQLMEMMKNVRSQCHHWICGKYNFNHLQESVTNMEKALSEADNANETTEKKTTKNLWKWLNIVRDTAANMNSGKISNQDAMKTIENLRKALDRYKFDQKKGNTKRDLKDT